MSSYIDHYEARIVQVPTAGGRMASRIERVCIHSWAEDADRRLTWLYGPERAAAIRAGLDAATNADLSAWKRLGSRRAAA